MSIILCAGVDPGIVHTGVVTLMMDPEARTFDTYNEPVVGADPDEVMTALENSGYGIPDHTFIEKYNPRSAFKQDKEMIVAVSELNKHLPNSKVINNMGSKQVIRKPLLDQLDLWVFPATHHQDLQAAARIMIYGMLKNPELNTLLADFVKALYDGQPWRKL